jgi:hypothetical protein
MYVCVCVFVCMRCNPFVADAPRRRNAVFAAAATLPAQGATSSYDCTGVLISVPNPVVEYSPVPPEYPVIEPSALCFSSCTTEATVEYPLEYP